VSLVLALLLAPATSGFAQLVCGDGRHHMPCCESEEGCQTPSFSQGCCGAQPVAPAAPASASEGPSKRALAHPATPAAMVADRLSGPLSSERRLAFELDLLRLVHDPPYLRNGTLLI
jgi:hypothetical protein